MLCPWSGISARKFLLAAEALGWTATIPPGDVSSSVSLWAKQCWVWAVPPWETDPENPSSGRKCYWWFNRQRSSLWLYWTLATKPHPFMTALVAPYSFWELLSLSLAVHQFWNYKTELCPSESVIISTFAVSEKLEYICLCLGKVGLPHACSYTADVQPCLGELATWKAFHKPFNWNMGNIYGYHGNIYCACGYLGILMGRTVPRKKRIL